MSSDEIHRFGTVNAGILDQSFALQWVQSYIHLFGGDRTRVTISGESAGGGSVMLQTMAYGGTLGDSLFQNVSKALPYQLAISFTETENFRPSQLHLTCQCNTITTIGSHLSRTMHLPKSSDALMIELTEMLPKPSSSAFWGKTP